jgi:uncharacterized membrane protein YphA (DoxX/SURF4 family)
MILDRRRILGGFAVLALVLLRLVIGWHFFGEGTKKLQYDHQAKWFRMAFSADDFLNVAKGPLADMYHAYMPAEHEWRKLLATPLENTRETPEQAAERTKWEREYSQRRAAAEKKGEAAPIEFPPSAPYHEWATRIADDWRAIAEKAKAVAGMTEEQKKQIDNSLRSHLDALSTYLAGEEDAIAEYRHDMGRVKNWRESPEAESVPFYEQRIKSKTAETTGKLMPWLKQVQSLEAEYHADLERILTPKQRENANTTAAYRTAVMDANESKLHTLNVVVTILTISVGTCLLLGFFTRLASIAGAVFLVGVIASQPFWLADALPTMPYFIEFAGLLVLAGTGAGRWLGIDGLIYALFHRSRTLVISEN